MSTTTTEQRREDTMRKIRALLAKANDRAVTPEESEVFQAKADELMTKFAISEWELIKTGRITTAPIQRSVDMSWYRNAEIDSDVRNYLWAMMQSVYRHARCIPVSTQYDGRTIKCVGYPGDMDYADLLFTSLMFQLTRATNPQIDPDLGWYENAVQLREAGLQWKEIIRRMHLAGKLPQKYEEAGWDSRWTYVNMSETVKRRYGRFAQHHATYRRSFASGFVYKVADRLAKMRADAEHSTTKDDNPYAVVVRDVRETVLAFMHEQFPESAAKARGSGGGRVAQRAFDFKAAQKGSQAGEQADLFGHTDKRVANKRGELES